MLQTWLVMTPGLVYLVCRRHSLSAMLGCALFRRYRRSFYAWAAVQQAARRRRPAMEATTQRPVQHLHAMLKQRQQLREQHCDYCDSMVVMCEACLPA